MSFPSSCAENGHEKKKGGGRESTNEAHRASK
jgi:hypothetical protein